MRLWLFREEDGGDEFLVLDTLKLGLDELAEQYCARPIASLEVVIPWGENVAGWPTDCVLIAESD